MNSHHISKFLASVQVVLALFLGAIPFWLQPVCSALPDGHHMSCYYSAWLVVGAAGLLFFAAAVQLFLKSKAIQVAAAVVQLVLAFFAYAIPKRLIEVPYAVNPDLGKNLLFGICRHEEMACRHSFTTIPWVLLFIAALALLYLILKLVTRES